MRAAFLLITCLLLAAPTAQAGSTSLSMRSEPGDFVGAGQEYLYTLADGTFSIHKNAGNGVSITFNTPNFSDFWHLDFAASQGQLLTVGPYTGATRFPFQEPEVPGLSVFGNGRGCNMLTGSFEILEVSYGAGDEILAFRARFEQHCEGQAPALRGEIRFNATVPIELSAPTHVSVIEGAPVSFHLTATPAAGGTVILSATGVPPGAVFVDHGNNTGTFDWTTVPGQAGTYVVGFHATGMGGATESTFTRINVVPPPPANDEFENATSIESLPFSATQTTASATTAADDPFCSGNGASVWFTFTATTTMRIEADTFGSAYDTALSVYTGARGSLLALACNDNAEGTLQSRVRFNVTAGVTYYLMVSAFAAGPGGPLVLNVKEGPPPLSIDVSLFRFGSLSLTSGAAEVTGSVSCSQPALAVITGQLVQRHGNTALSGHFSAVIFCDGTSSWQASVFVPPAMFRGRAAALLVAGPATVAANAFAFDFETGEFVQRNLIVDIILRGR